MSHWYTQDYRDRMRDEYERIRAKHPSLVTKAFECLMGWYPIIESHFDAVAPLLAEYPGSTYELLQVKEKFAGLRLYADASDDIRAAVTAAYDVAAYESERTCDVCGSPAALRNMKGVFATRCDRHSGGADPLPPPTWSVMDYDDEDPGE